MLHRLLVGVDGSVYGWAAARLAAEVARLCDAEVILVHVAHVPVEWFGASSGVATSGVGGGLLDWARDASAEVLAEAQPYFQGVRLETLAEVGHPLGILLNLAQQDVDLVVVGSRGRSELRALLLGSTSDGLAHHAPCSVLIARPRSPAELEVGLHRMLLAVDGSPPSRKAAALAAQLAARAGAEVLVVHVFDADHPPHGRRGLTPTPQEAAQARQALVDDVVAEVQGAGAIAAGRIASGRPADTICQLAAAEEFDLVVVGSRGLGAVSSLLLGSVSDRITHHCPCSVLIVR